MNIRAQIVGIDVLWFDQLVTLPHMPTDNGSLKIESTSCQGGGKVCTALVAAARQGITCKILGVHGTGARSEFLVKDFERHGVDTRSLRTISGYQEGSSIVLSDAESGGRRIFWAYDDTQLGLTTEDIDSAAADIAAASYLHLCRMDAVDCYAADLARKHNTKVCLDADFYSPEIAAALGRIDILIGSEEFYLAMFPQGGNLQDHMLEITQQGPSTVMFTFGKNGCKGYADGCFFTAEAFHENITVVDTVGAGDVFHGGYLAALCLGLDSRQAARYASAVSAIKCTAIGGRAGIPSRSMVEEYLQNGTFSRDEIEERAALYRKIV